MKEGHPVICCPKTGYTDFVGSHRNAEILREGRESAPCLKAVIVLPTALSIRLFGLSYSRTSPQGK